MWDETTDHEYPIDWTPVALRGGLARLCVPPDWQRISRDDGGLAFQSPGDNPVDLLVSITTYRNPYGVKPDEAIQYLDRENVLPHGIAPSEDEEDGDRRWIAYAVAQPPDRQIFVWKVADFRPPDHVRVVTVQLLVPEVSAAQPDLADLVERLGEEAAKVEFTAMPVQEPVKRVTMRNVSHGDLVRFRLPWDWNATAEGELTLFYREQEDSGTLRVAVHAFPYGTRVPEGTEPDAEAGFLLDDPDLQEPEAEPVVEIDPLDYDRAAAAARILLRQTAEQFADGPDGRVGQGSVEWLDNSEVLARFTTTGEEDGERLRFHLWLRGSALDGQTTLALFSYAVAEELRDGAEETVGMLEQEIRNAVVGPGALEE